MIYAALLAFGVVFVELFLGLRLLNEVGSIFRLSKEASGVLTSKELSDDEKEVRIRGASLNIFKATAMFIVKFAVIAAALAALYFALIQVLPERRAELDEGLTSWFGIVFVTVAMLIYVRIRNVAGRKLQSH